MKDVLYLDIETKSPLDLRSSFDITINLATTQSSETKILNQAVPKIVICRLAFRDDGMYLSRSILSNYPTYVNDDPCTWHLCFRSNMAPCEFHTGVLEEDTDTSICR